MKFDVKRIEIIDDPGAETEAAQIAQCHVEIGYQGALGADIFFVDVCNPKWAEENLCSGRTECHPKFLIVERIDERSIRAKVEEKFLDKEYLSFEELVSRAAPLMRWEFS